MSDNQMEKLQIEREALGREVALLKAAVPVKQAAQKLMDSMANKQDPLSNPDNEWIANNAGGPPCCSIM